MIAVVGDNRGTELSDFMVPYGVLSEANVADVIAVSTQPGPMDTFTDLGVPAFRIVAQATLSDFDGRYPNGADYVIVPAQNPSAELLHWLADQTSKGAVLVSICNGAMVVAKTGVMAGHRATAHWSTESQRLAQNSDIHWVKNARYVSDGNWVSSAGVSAAIPTSLALVEAIAGHGRAASLAEEMGSGPWSPQHNSDAFHPRLTTTAWPLAKVAYTNGWFHGTDTLSVHSTPGMDEASLALTVDAYSSTGRSRAYLVSSSEAGLLTRHGLTVLPDRTDRAPVAAGNAVTLSSVTPPAKALDVALAGIMQRYDHATASGVALVFEYPDFK
ncbi:AraC family transcriptional regulator [Dyella soli]|uniref:AraC family transcriptional regulator n=1 Tax=Dyella soli TaxID=522319 RepID=A0A4R0YJQ3_9GAMM|nr:AraC family transcriptional regulator [Dyella soli]